MTSLTGPSVTTSYIYNGLGDRLQETVGGQTTTFTMDLNTGLTQALSDGTHTYLYGVGRIAQVDTSAEYFLGDALGSVRQLTDATGVISYTQTYDPYGVVADISGASQSTYGYTGEYQDSAGMLYLRARHYAPEMGRFLTRDTWAGNYNRPLSLNRWNYVEGNPVNLTDPSGKCPLCWILIFRALSTSSCTTVPDEVPAPDSSVTQSLVTLNIDHPNLGLGVALGTAVNNKRTIVTAEHNIPKYTSDQANIKIFGLNESNKFENHVEFQYSELRKYMKYEDGRDMVTITLPVDIPGNLVPAKPATNYRFTKGDFLTITGYLDNNVAIAQVNRDGLISISLGDFIEGSALLATADDLTNFSRGGDSGGGVFYNGLYVGFFSAKLESMTPPQIYITPYKLHQ